MAVVDGKSAEMWGLCLAQVVLLDLATRVHEEADADGQPPHEGHQLFAHRCRNQVALREHHVALQVRGEPVPRDDARGDEPGDEPPPASPSAMRAAKRVPAAQA